MRHRVKGRTLGRNGSHRKAMFRNMAASLIKTLRIEEEPKEGSAKVSGRIVTTVAKAKELRPIVEKLVTLARKAVKHEEAAKEFATAEAKNSEGWKAWRSSDQWQKWSAAIAPAVAMRRRAFSALRDKEAVSILFAQLGPRFLERDGGYTRIIKLAKPRLGDAGVQAIIEFVGNERDRVKRGAARVAPAVVDSPAPVAAPEEEAVKDAPEPSAEAAETTGSEATAAGDEE
ncbi:MAG: 50S ribosomal protein L17 [Planctomycetaceae bacterium]|nr:50S ribosomal protein L17 [Planctomycetaceae bacterium]